MLVSGTEQRELKYLYVVTNTGVRASVCLWPVPWTGGAELLEIPTASHSVP